jgi:hypothetical protein
MTAQAGQGVRKSGGAEEERRGSQRMTTDWTASAQVPVRKLEGQRILALV